MKWRATASAPSRNRRITGTGYAAHNFAILGQPPTFATRTAPFLSGATPSRRPHDSVNVRSLEPVEDGRRSALQARVAAGGGRRPLTGSKLRRQEAFMSDGAPRHTATNADPPNLGRSLRRFGK